MPQKLRYLRPSCQLFIILVVMIFHTSLVSASQVKFQVGYVHSPPFVVMHPNGDTTGYFADLMRDLADECGYEVDYNYLSFKRLYSAIESGNKSQVQFITKGIKRFDDVLVFSQAPITQIRLKLYWLNTQYRKNRVFSLNELKEKRVAVIRGYHYANTVTNLKTKFPSIEFIEVDFTISGIKMLTSERVDFFLDYERIVDATLSEKDKLKLKSNLVKGVDYYISAHKSLRNAEEVVNCLGNAFKGKTSNKRNRD